MEKKKMKENKSNWMHVSDVRIKFVKAFEDCIRNEKIAKDKKLIRIICNELEKILTELHYLSTIFGESWMPEKSIFRELQKRCEVDKMVIIEMYQFK
jgi:hypothetical protein